MKKLNLYFFGEEEVALSDSGLFYGFFVVAAAVGVITLACQLQL